MYMDLAVYRNATKHIFLEIVYDKYTKLDICNVCHNICSIRIFFLVPKKNICIFKELPIFVNGIINKYLAENIYIELRLRHDIPRWNVTKFRSNFNKNKTKKVLELAIFFRNQYLYNNFSSYRSICILQEINSMIKFIDLPFMYHIHKNEDILL